MKLPHKLYIKRLESKKENTNNIEKKKNLKFAFANTAFGAFREFHFWWLHKGNHRAVARKKFD